MNENRPEARKDLVLQGVTQDLLVYDSLTNQAHLLNPLTADVLRACDGTRTLEDICSALAGSDHLEISQESVQLALDSLEAAGLLQGSQDIPPLPVKRPLKFTRRRTLTGAVSALAATAIVSVFIAGPAAAASVACVNPGRAPAGTFLGGAGGSGACSTPGAADATCTTVRGNLCCSGMAIALQCFDSGPGPNLGTYSVTCQCT